MTNKDITHEAPDEDEPQYHPLTLSDSNGDQLSIDSANIGPKDDPLPVAPVLKSDLVNHVTPELAARKQSVSQVMNNSFNSNSITMPALPIPDQSTLGVATPLGSPNEHRVKYVNEFPTDLLVDRFYKWKKILKGLVIYLKEVSYAQEQFARINSQLQGNVKFPFLTDLENETHKIYDPLKSNVPIKIPQPSTIAEQKKTVVVEEDEQFQPVHDHSSAASGFLKFGSGSIQDIQVVLKKYHLSLAAQQFKVSKELVKTVIPNLEELRKDLAKKVKEIKGLRDDFKTNLKEHMDVTAKLMARYNNTIKLLEEEVNNPTFVSSSNPKNDPYLLKLQLELQIKRQLFEENYLKEAFVNLQSSGMKLEKIVYIRIQASLQRFSSLIDSEARLTIKNLCHELHSGIVSKPPAVEWDHFVSHHPTALVNWKSFDPLPTPRKMASISFPQMNSPLAKCIRAGQLNKTSKLTPNGSSHYYVLTSNFLHEFKDGDFFKLKQDDSTHSSPYSSKESFDPGMSVNLNNCAFIESSETQFILVCQPNFKHLSKTSTVASNPILSKSTEVKSTGLAKIKSHTPSTSSKKLGNLLKGTKSRDGTDLQLERKVTQEEKAYLESINQNLDNATINLVFTISTDSPAEDDLKQFKKWIHELKQLTSFDTTSERKAFIEKRILHRKSTYSGKPILSKVVSHYDKKNIIYEGHKLSKTVSETVDDGKLSDKSMPVKNPSKPNYIPLGKVTSQELATQRRSKINSPAVDDKDNLVLLENRSVADNGVHFASIPTTGALAKYNITSMDSSTSTGSNIDPHTYFEIPLEEEDAIKGKQQSGNVTQSPNYVAQAPLNSFSEGVPRSAQSILNYSTNSTIREIFLSCNGALNGRTEKTLRNSSVDMKLNNSSGSSADTIVPVHQAPKQRKSITLSGLNSWIFARKGSNSSDTASNSQEDIQENNVMTGNDPKLNGDTHSKENQIKLNQSIYS